MIKQNFWSLKKLEILKSKQGCLNLLSEGKLKKKNLKIKVVVFIFILNSCKLV